MSQLLPIKNLEIWNLYKVALSTFWTADEIDLTQDMDDWKKLSDDDRLFIKKVLAFFALSDAIVSDNLALHFTSAFDEPEIKNFYGFQLAIENIHHEMYSIMIHAFIEDQEERDACFDLESDPCILAKGRFAQKHMNDKMDLPSRVLAFVIFEGIFFCSSFAAIYWVKTKQVMPGLCLSNTYIARDEHLHATFGCEILKRIGVPKNAIDVIKEAVLLEKDFVEKALPRNLLNMDKKKMSQYVEFVADFWAKELQLGPIYNTQNPFHFMKMINFDTQTNFFEHRSAEYSIVNSADENF